MPFARTSPLRYLATALSLVLLSLVASGASAAGGGELCCVRVRNQTCMVLSDFTVHPLVGKKPKPPWCLGSVGGKASMTYAGEPAVADGISLSFCTSAKGGMQGRKIYNPKEGPPRPIRSVFVHLGCCPGDRYALLNHCDRGAPTRIKLTAFTGTCPGTGSSCTARVAAPPARQDILQVSAKRGPKESGPLSFKDFRVANEHASKRIVRARARVKYASADLPDTVVHQDVGPATAKPPIDPITNTYEPIGLRHDADEVLVLVCRSDAPPQVFRGYLGGGEDNLIESARVVLDRDGNVRVWGVPVGAPPEDEFEFDPVANPDPSDSCPRLESFRVYNELAAGGPDVLMARAIPSVDVGGVTVTGAALPVANIAPGANGTYASLTYDEGSTVVVSICVEGSNTSIQHRLTLNDPAHRFKTVTARVRPVAGQLTVEFEATYWDAGASHQPPVPLPAGSCPFP